MFSHSCNGTNIFIRWKLKCTIQLGLASLNGTFHLSPYENICTIALINIHYLYIISLAKNARKGNMHCPETLDLTKSLYIQKNTILGHLYLMWSLSLKILIYSKLLMKKRLCKITGLQRLKQGVWKLQTPCTRGSTWIVSICLPYPTFLM